MQKVRPTGKLIEALMTEADDPVSAKGGWGARIRRQQGLMREAALSLAKWGRPESSRKRQSADLFKRDAA